MKRLVNCSSYDFIKRSLCTVVAGAFVLSAASCNQLTSDQTKDSLNVNSEESSDTTSSEETSKAVNLTFEEVQKTVLEKLEYDESDLKKPNEEDMLKNSYIGIVNLIRLNPPHYSESSDTKEDDVLVRADILEFDTNSFEYRNLKVGDEVSFFSGFGFPVGATVSAINGKFVICLCGTKGESGTDSYVSEHSPDYTLGNLQEIYEAFAKLPEVFSKHFHDVVISKEGQNEGLEQLLKASYKGEEIKLDQDDILRKCVITMPTDSKRNMMNASSNFDIINCIMTALRGNTKMKFFSPGVFGNIGGFPVIVDGTTDEPTCYIDESVFSLDDMISKNRQSLALDGVEDIRNGCLVYTDDLIKKSEKAFGVTLPKIVPYDNIDATAEFIIKDIINPALEKGLNK